MRPELDNDWKANIARNYFALTWDGPIGEGVADGLDNIHNIYEAIDNVFHHDYVFTRPDGVLINSGTKKLKEILYNLTTPLLNLKMTSFDIMSVTTNSVSFQSTAIADKKANGERYTQCLRLTYLFEEKKVRQTVVHYHSNYEEH